MKYERIIRAKFVARPNRFVAIIDVEGNEELCHIKNTGRLKELLVPGATIFVQQATGATRKTRYDLISVYKGQRLVNVDSQAPNQIAIEYLPQVISGVKLIKPEIKFGNSRFDLYLETDCERYLAEVKGVTLEKAGVAMFPDAPTERGLRHLKELGRSLKMGYKALMLFVIQMKGVKYFTPNDDTHRAFGEMLRRVSEAGVGLLAVDCHVTETGLIAADPVEIVLR